MKNKLLTQAFYAELIKVMGPGILAQRRSDMSSPQGKSSVFLVVSNPWTFNKCMNFQVHGLRELTKTKVLKTRHLIQKNSPGIWVRNAERTFGFILRQKPDPGQKFSSQWYFNISPTGKIWCCKSLRILGVWHCDVYYSVPSKHRTKIYSGLQPTLLIHCICTID